MENLKNLLKSIDVYALHGDTDVIISAICFDSRTLKCKKTEKGKPLYVAQRGESVDGHLFINEAISLGAGVIVCEEFPAQLQNDVTYIMTSDTQIALGEIADAFYDHPSSKLKLVGVTGTNGKTTIVTLLYRLFTLLGYPVGMISTIENKICDRSVPATHTTPDAVMLNRLLSEMVDAGCEFCFMEVSSHAIFQNRIAGLHYTGAVFSNITHDHLDFHKTFAAYIEAKKSFFDTLTNETFALTNNDDRNGLVMVQNSMAQVHTYSLQTVSEFKGRIIDDCFEGLQMEINGKELFFSLCGRFNAYNLLAVYGTAILLDMPEEDILSTMSLLEPVAGRFQLMRNSQECIAVVDYAHTPDALKNVLLAIRDITHGKAKIITVVGCGGDRDAEKRPIMAQIASEYSNKVIITSDNPRSENPVAIMKEMEDGVPVVNKKRVLLVENRREAIKAGCMLLSAQDVLLVAGKGHETYQEINNVKHHFDDVEEIKKIFYN